MQRFAPSNINSNLVVADISNQVTVSSQYVDIAKLYCYGGHVYQLFVRITGDMPTGWTGILSWSTNIGPINTIAVAVAHGNTDNLSKPISAIANPTSLNSKYGFITYNGDLGALSAGASGYITASVTIPTEYRTTGIASIAKQHIAGAAGLTIMANMPRNNTGTVTFYPSYYTPTSVASGNADFQIRIFYERDV